MEALIYSFLTISTLMILFFAAFFRETPKINLTETGSEN